MKIFNQSKNTVLAEAVIIADRLFPRMKGLLGKKELKPNEAIVLKPCNSIHTLFMRFPIDVLFIDKHNKAIEVISNLKPYRLTRIYFNARFAIELPSGTLQATATAKDDTLLLI
ncbi:MAG: DUF192 domain-containing protein [Candidatus Omnitrophota bacterium]|jgi:hypothetical protein